MFSSNTPLVDGYVIMIAAKFSLCLSTCETEKWQRELMRGNVSFLTNSSFFKRIKKDDIERCIISCMKRVASPGSMHDTGCLGLVNWDDPEGWHGEGGGFRMGNTCIPVADSF